MAAGIEGRGTMRCADGDEYAGFANFQTAEAMRDGDAMNCKILVEMGGDFRHFEQRHGFVRFVVKVQCGAVMRLVADKAVERDDGTVLRGTNVTGELRRIQGIAGQLDDVVFRGRSHARMLSLR